MTTARVALACCLVCSACELSSPPRSDSGVPAPAGGGAGGGTGGDTGMDAGAVAVEFVPFTPPARRQHLGLVSDGTTVFDSSGPAVSVSTDVGRTWSDRGARTGQLALVGSTTVYVLGPAGLSRSDDAAQTFTDVSLPAAAVPSTTPLLSTTTDGAVWIYLQTLPPELYRSTDRGATFLPVPLPMGTTVLRRCSSFDGTFVAARNATEMVRFDGTGFVTLAPVSRPTACLVTPAGTVLVSAYDTEPYQLRLGSGAASPERQSLRGASAYVRQGTDVVRTLGDGTTDRSSDDGATWTSQVTTAVNGFAINEVVSAGTTLLTNSTQGLAELPVGASAWQIVEDPGLPNFLRVADLAFARRAAARALLLEDNTQRTLFVSPDGATWTRGLTLGPGDARAIALSPSGDQVFVGGIQGRWRLLAADGRTELRTGTLDDGAGRTDVNPIQQAVWDGDSTGSVIIVSTANDVDSAGEVVSLDPAATLQAWQFHTPTSTTMESSWRPGGYHALAISPGGGTLNRRLFVSFRTLLSANSWSTSQLVWNRAFESQAFWEAYEGPVAATAALSASYSTVGAGPLAVLWSDGRLHVGTSLLGLPAVPTGLQLASARVVRFAADGRLWIGGPGGLFFTRDPLGVP